MNAVVQIEQPDRAPAAALVDAEIAVGREFDSNPDLFLIKEAIAQLRLRDWSAASAILEEIAASSKARLQAILARERFRMLPAASSADAIPRSSLIHSVRTEQAVSAEEFKSCIVDFAGTMAHYANGDEAVLRATKLVLWSALTGRFVMMNDFLLNLSPSYRKVLNSILFEHDLVLWDPIKQRAMRIWEN